MDFGKSRPFHFWGPATFQGQTVKLFNLTGVTRSDEYQYKIQCMPPLWAAGFLLHVSYPPCLFGSGLSLPMVHHLTQKPSQWGSPENAKLFVGIYDKLKLFEKKNVKTLEMIFPIMHTGDSLLIMVPYGRKNNKLQQSSWELCILAFSMLFSNMIFLLHR